MLLDNIEISASGKPRAQVHQLLPLEGTEVITPARHSKNREEEGMGRDAPPNRHCLGHLSVLQSGCQ